MSLVDPKELDAEIHAREFDRVLKGYNPEQVNGFLNRILRQYKDLYIRNRELEEELEKVKKEQDILKETFFHAQETANQIVAEAKQAGEEERKRASREADQIIQNAKDRAEELYLTIVLQNEKYKDAVNKLVDESYAISKTHIQALANELFHKIDSAFQTLKEGNRNAITQAVSATADTSLSQPSNAFRQLRDKEEFVLVGKRLTKDIVDSKGQVVATKGEIVTSQLLAECIEKELYGQLVVAVGGKG